MEYPIVTENHWITRKPLPIDRLEQDSNIHHNVKHVRQSLLKLVCFNHIYIGNTLTGFRVWFWIVQTLWVMFGMASLEWLVRIDGSIVSQYRLSIKTDFMNCEIEFSWFMLVFDYRSETIILCDNATYWIDSHPIDFEKYGLYLI